MRGPDPTTRQLLLALALLSPALLQEETCSQDQTDCRAAPENKFRPAVKTVLVTGGSGFVAHHVIETILDTTDWNVVSLDRLDLSGRVNRLEQVLAGREKERRRVRVIYADLRAEINGQLAKDIGPVQVILHLAAGANVDRSIERPLEFVMDNTVATVNMMEFARKQHPDLDRFIYLSTAEVFGPAPQGVTHTEYDRYNSGNPYAAAKVETITIIVTTNSKLILQYRPLLRSSLWPMRTLTRCR